MSDLGRARDVRRRKRSPPAPRSTITPAATPASCSAATRAAASRRGAGLGEPGEERRVARLEADVDAPQAERRRTALLLGSLAVAGPGVDEGEEGGAGEARGHASRSSGSRRSLGQAEGVGVAEEDGAAQRERRGRSTRAARRGGRAARAARLPAEGHVAVQAAERCRRSRSSPRSRARPAPGTGREAGCRPARSRRGSARRRCASAAASMATTSRRRRTASASAPCWSRPLRLSGDPPCRPTSAWAPSGQGLLGLGAGGLDDRLALRRREPRRSAGRLGRRLALQQQAAVEAAPVRARSPHEGVGAPGQVPRDTSASSTDRTVEAPPRSSVAAPAVRQREAEEADASEGLPGTRRLADAA